MKRIAVFVLAVIISIASSGQSGKLPNSLLWKISGNGLQDNSYLFGSMHLQDKRIFNFSDSLFYFLEKSKGFALEIDVQEFMDSVLQRSMLDGFSQTPENKKREALEERVLDSLLGNLEMHDRKSRKLLYEYRKGRVRPAARADDMSTFVDAYLYGVARKLGKELGAVEDVEDQLALYDELGGTARKRDLVDPDDEVRAGIESMIQIYIKQDLNKIYERSYSSFKGEAGDLILIRRNLKMTGRMDSLSHLRSTFFTVGAAHLPGDSGIIQLLRNRGFTLTPVFSQHKVDPVRYAANLQQLPWARVADETGTYTLEMPGPAMDINVYGGLATMKYHMDITDMTMYMSASVLAGNTADMSTYLKSLETTTGSVLLDKKVFEKDGFRFADATFLKSGYYFKVRYISRSSIIYTLIAAKQKRQDLASTEITRFFNSFRAVDKPVIAGGTDWSLLHLPAKAFRINFPGKATSNKAFDAVANGSQWNYTSFDYSDLRRNRYFLLQVRDVNVGYTMPADSICFTDQRTLIKRLADDTKLDSQYSINGYPALRIDGTTTATGLLYRTLEIIRGNRIYAISSISGPDSPVDSTVDQYFNSFSMTEYLPAPWAEQHPADGSFTAWMPGAIGLPADTTAEGEDINLPEQFETYNPNDALSTLVFRSVLPKYYSETDDSSFYEPRIRAHIQPEDSVIYKKAVTNGALNGLEVLFIKSGQTLKGRVRFIPNRDTLYTLFSWIGNDEASIRNNEHFFSTFRVANELPGKWITTSKASMIFADLQSADSATFATAYNGLSDATFTRQDLPLLHEGLLHRYYDELHDDYTGATETIKRKLAAMRDPATVEFVKRQYPLLHGKEEDLKLQLLDVLAGNRTIESFDLLRNLLVEQTPQTTGDGYLGYHLTDSLQLTRTLFPDVLVLLKNNLFAERIIEVAGELVDSNLLSADLLIPYRATIQHTADTILKSAVGEDFSGWKYAELVHLLGRFNDEASAKLLYRFIKLQDLYIKQEAIFSLLKKEHPVDPKQLETIAASGSYRIDFYSGLKAIGKEKLFPPKYLSQKSFAESWIYSYASDDYDPKEIKFVGERIEIYNGVKRKFFLFNVIYEEEDGEDSYLGIAGPYDIDARKIESGHGVSEILWDEKFDAKTYLKMFRDYLAGLQQQ